MKRTHRTNWEGREVWSHHYKTDRTRSGYFGIQCTTKDPDSKKWECVFPIGMIREEVNDAIKQIFDEEKAVKEILYYYNGIRYQATRDETRQITFN